MGAASSLGAANALEATRPAAPAGTRACRALRVALVTDVHAPRSWVPIETLAETIQAFDPDLLFIVGDSIDRRNEEAQVRAFGRLSARYGKFAAVGNHEHWSVSSFTRLRREYERADVRLLVNEQSAVDVGGTPVVISGLDDWRAGTPDYALVADGQRRWRDAAHRIVLAHCPAAFDAIRAASTLPLDVLAGHTHAGQVAPFGVPIVLPYGSGEYVTGWYTARQHAQRMYVSRGVGNSGIPLRVGARPEVALLSL